MASYIEVIDAFTTCILEYSLVGYSDTMEEEMEYWGIPAFPTVLMHEELYPGYCDDEPRSLDGLWNWVSILLNCPELNVFDDENCRDPLSGILLAYLWIKGNYQFVDDVLMSDVYWN